MGRANHKRAASWFLREWREQAGLSQDKLAEIIGTTKGQISKLESGDQRYNQDWVERAAEALQIAPVDLFRDPATPSADSLLARMTKEDRDRALAILRTLAGG